MALAGVDATATARPRAEEVVVRTGLLAEVAGTGCAASRLLHPLGEGNVVALDPPVGEDVGDVDSLLVTEAAVGSGQAYWTVLPSATECALRGPDSIWPWTTGARAWTITQRDTRFALRVHASRGVRSIAGFDVRWKGRSGPSIGRARRHFGKPSTVKRRYGVSCRVTWKRIGLTIDFLNLGLGDPCRHGYVQAGRITGPQAGRWAAMPGSGAAWSTGTSEAYFEDTSTGEPGDERRWTLAEIYMPYGDGGYVPSLSALLTSTGTVGGYEFWVGAGGD